jgi:membrane fusion protein, macrolide-specific efflux system
LDFKPGMTVEVEYDNVSYVGEVLSAAAGSSAGSSEKVLKVDVKDLPQGVKRGKSATIKLVLERSEDTLIIPKLAIRKYTGRTYVQILEDGIKKERDVVTGVESAIEIEITEGLKEGDLVIMG